MSNIQDLPIVEGGANTAPVQLFVTPSSGQINSGPPANPNAASESQSTWGPNQLAEIAKNLDKIREATSFPAKHLPVSTAGLAMDPASVPTYIPPSNQGRYITPLVDTSGLGRTNVGWAEFAFDHLQLPLLLALVYFLFHVPSFVSTVHRTVPSLFNSEQNYTLTGKIVISALFGMVVQGILFYLQYMKT